MFMARRATKRKDYELSYDLYRLVLKHFPDTNEAQKVEEGILQILKAQRRDAEEFEAQAQEKERSKPSAQ